jgi:hypothetical protein
MTKWEDEAGQWRPLDLMIYENFVLIKFGRSAEANSHFMPSHGEEEGAEEAGRTERKRTSHCSSYPPHIIYKNKSILASI